MCVPLATRCLTALLQSPIEAEGGLPERSPSTLATPSLRAILAGEEPEQQQHGTALIAPAAAPAAEGVTLGPETATNFAAVSAPEVPGSVSGAAAAAAAAGGIAHPLFVTEGHSEAAGSRRSSNQAISVRSTATVYYDANDLIEAEEVSSGRRNSLEDAAPGRRRSLDDSAMDRFVLQALSAFIAWVGGGAAAISGWKVAIEG